MTLAEELKTQGVKLVRKDNSRLMRVIGWFFNLFKWLTKFDFMEDAWTTVGGKTIYFPVDYPLSYEKLQGISSSEVTIRHELVHIRQARKYPVWFQVSYLLFPIFIFFAWFRWRWEREAYMVNIRAGADIDRIVDILWKVYLFPWPKPWMRKWFREQVAKGA